MHIRVERYFFMLPGRAERYLIGVQKPDGRERQYVVEINPLHSAMHFLFTERWSRYFVENFAWMVSFYPYDALLLPGESGRFRPDTAMGFTRNELEKLMVQGIGAAINDFAQRYQPLILVAVAIRENLGRLYHRLLVRHAGTAGYHYHQIYVQEALYVLEKQWKQAKSGGAERPAGQGRDCRLVAGLHA